MGKGTSGKGEKGFAGGLGFWGGVEQSHSGGLASSNYVLAHNILDTRKELDQFFCINAVRYLKLVEIWDQTLVHIRFFFFSYSLIYASLTVALLLYRSCVLYQLQICIPTHSSTEIFFFSITVCPDVYAPFAS